MRRGRGPTLARRSVRQPNGTARQPVDRERLICRFAQNSAWHVRRACLEFPRCEDRERLPAQDNCNAKRLDSMTIGFDTLHNTNGNGNGLNGSHACIGTVGRESSVRKNTETNELEQAVRTILKAVGEDPDRPGLLDTPRRVAKMYREMFAGLHLDPGRHLEVTFPEDYNELVLVRDIPFTSMCEHHLLPFSGVAHVAYLPDGRVTGLSKLARVVEEVARRPQVQERMTNTVADLIDCIAIVAQILCDSCRQLGIVFDQ